MKAENLTIQGKKINRGDVYYTVSVKSPFYFHEIKATSENNTLFHCYFLMKSEALHYKRLSELSELMNIHIKEIEKIHHNR